MLSDVGRGFHRSSYDRMVGWQTWLAGSLGTIAKRIVDWIGRRRAILSRVLDLSPLVRGRLRFPLLGSKRITGRLSCPLLDALNLRRRSPTQGVRGGNDVRGSRIRIRELSTIGRRLHARLGAGRELPQLSRWLEPRRFAYDGLLVRSATTGRDRRIGLTSRLLSCGLGRERPEQDSPCTAGGQSPSQQKGSERSWTTVSETLKTKAMET